MEPAQLQLAINVIAITGVSSLASFCYLLKKENRKLAAGLKGDPSQQERPSSVTVPVAQPQASPATPAIEATAQDIRQFAAGRRNGWVKGLSSSIMYDGCC